MSKKRKGKEKAREESNSDHDSDTIDRETLEISSTARNPSGKNQYTSTPSLQEIANILREYHKSNPDFRYADYIDALARDHGYKIGRTKIAGYLSQLGLSTSSCGNRMPKSEKTQIILDELAKDPLQTRGPRAIKESLNILGHKIGRGDISDVMHDFEEEGFKKRHPRAKKKTNRTPLTAVGPDEEWSMDGHDKLNAAGFGVYGIRDKWAKKRLHYRVVPSNRYTAVVGVVFLECVKKCGGIPIQGSSDRGSEIRDVEMFAPDLLDAVVPSWMFLPSPQNITVESGWRSLFYTWGVNVLEFYNSGLHGGFFEQGNIIHEQTARWIWFPVVQRSLDNFCNEQNNHRIRKQTEKLLPSGGTPNQFYSNLAKYGGKSCLIPVEEAVVDELLANCQEGHERMRYVDTAFEEIAQAAYDALEQPEITLQNAWTVFRAMIGKLEM
ncbi:hypothetical protein DFH07DRAFT_766191 [Mycena maculata]|uniref:Integrase core domain-containing protein n=1 Tax=Mycena maculata TaxID=230809 RepID=A0AAD7K445_9AGAR|nr:hypothetical protein DFH07DRAFT_766191 [Mycena maculata]